MGVGRGLALLWMCGGFMLLPATLSPQTPQTPRMSRPVAASAVDKEMVKRGEGVFSRHCPICHLGRPAETRPYIGRNLRGIFKNAKPEQEAAAREFIRAGSDRMPGYQHSLTPAQLDDLIAYLKTYN